MPGVLTILKNCQSEVSLSLWRISHYGGLAERTNLKVQSHDALVSVRVMALSAA